MRRLNEATIKKAEAILNQSGSIVTGQGLGRKELRQLERAGYIERRLMRNKDTGTLIYEWRPVLVSKEIIKNTLQMD